MSSAEQEHPDQSHEQILTVLDGVIVEAALDEPDSFELWLTSGDDELKPHLASVAEARKMVDELDELFEAFDIDPMVESVESLDPNDPEYEIKARLVGLLGEAFDYIETNSVSGRVSRFVLERDVEPELEITDYGELDKTLNDISRRFSGRMFDYREMDPDDLPPEVSMDMVIRFFYMNDKLHQLSPYKTDDEHDEDPDEFDDDSDEDAVHASERRDYLGEPWEHDLGDDYDGARLGYLGGGEGDENWNVRPDDEELELELGDYSAIEWADEDF